MRNLEILVVKDVEDFLVTKFPVNLPQGRIGLKFATENSWHSFFTLKFTINKDFCHLVPTLGAMSRNVAKCSKWHIASDLKLQSSNCRSFPEIGRFLNNPSIQNINCEPARLVTGKSLDSPEDRNADKMSKKYRKNVRKMPKNCPEGPKTQVSDIFWTIFAYLVDAFLWWPCPMLARYKARPLLGSLGPFGAEMPKKSRRCPLASSDPGSREVSKKSRWQSGKSERIKHAPNCYAHKTPHLKWSRKLSLPKRFKGI